MRKPYCEAWESPLASFPHRLEWRATSPSPPGVVPDGMKSDCAKGKRKKNVASKEEYSQGEGLLFFLPAKLQPKEDRRAA